MSRTRGAVGATCLVASSLLCVVCGACGQDEGVELRLLLDESPPIDRVHVAGESEGDEVFAPGVLPDPPRTLSSGDALVVLVPLDLAGERVRFVLEGRLGDELRSRGTTSILIREGEIIGREVRLGAVDAAGGDVGGTSSTYP